MKKTANLGFNLAALILVLSAGLACNFFSKSNPSENQTVSVNASPVAEKDTGTAPDKLAAKTEKADFTTTAEQLDKEYTRKGVKDEDLEKYANKNIAVTGRVSTLVFEKKGTTQPWVTLYAPGVLHGVSCYFDDDNLEEMKKLKMDKIVTVQGFQDDFIVPEVSPRLDHCVVIKAE